ncbi:MAG: RluA family pseudouridine synthase [bacterium]|nr:RluA family pseudouridine synthase [bacterium]
MERVLTGREGRLDIILRELFPDLSREKIKDIIESGKVSVDGKIITKPSFKVKTDSVIKVEEIDIHKDMLQPYDISVNIVYEDESIIVVDKPAGLVVHPAPSVKTPTLVNALIGKTNLALVNSVRPGVVHRLDKDTSGLMVLAKTFQSYNNLVKQIQDGKVIKEYIAVVHGKLKSGTIRAPIGRSPSDRTKMKVLPAGRMAVTHYEVIEIIGEYSILRVRIETGRTHQIRVHLAYIGHPIVGDTIYGIEEKEKLIYRQALHSSRLSFLHPITQERLEFSSPLPKDIEDLIEKLRRLSWIDL